MSFVFRYRSKGELVLVFTFIYADHACDWIIAWLCDQGIMTASSSVQRTKLDSDFSSTPPSGEEDYADWFPQSQGTLPPESPRSHTPFLHGTTALSAASSIDDLKAVSAGSSKGKEKPRVPSHSKPKINLATRPNMARPSSVPPSLLSASASKPYPSLGAKPPIQRTNTAHVSGSSSASASRAPSLTIPAPPAAGSSEAASAAQSSPSDPPTAPSTPAQTSPVLHYPHMQMFPMTSGATAYPAPLTPAHSWGVLLPTGAYGPGYAPHGYYPVAMRQPAYAPPVPATAIEDTSGSTQPLTPAPSPPSAPVTLPKGKVQDGGITKVPARR